MLMTGAGPIDAEWAFTRVARSRRRAALARRLRREPARGDRLPVYDERALPRSGAPGRGIREIPLEAISGTLEPSRATLVDRCFRPAGGPLPLAAALPGRAPRRRPAADLRRPGGRRVRHARRAPPCLGGEGAWGPHDRDATVERGSAGLGSA
jgi:hypothetical protein